MKSKIDFLKPNFESIPKSLRALPWAVWRAEPRQGQVGKFNKAPVSPLTGSKIGANKPQLFGTFDEAKSAYQNGEYTGVGLLLVGNGIVGVDIDSYHETVQDSPDVANWVKSALDARVYCERSPSGSGLRLFYTDPNCIQGKKKGSLEIYSNLRFLTVTGQTIKCMDELA